MKILFGILFVYFLSLTGMQGQSIPLCDEDMVEEGSLNIIAEQKIKELGKPIEPIPGHEVTFAGFRVQIYNGNDRTLAQKMKKDVLNLYPDQPVYLLYEAPYFKIRIGDYRDRLEAQKMLHDMKQTYTGVLLVPDQINFPEIR